MAVYHKGAISFGLVHIPVSMYTATRDDDIRFNQMHKEDGGRIGYKKICKHCGKEAASSEIVKAFEFEKDKFVTVEESELLKLQSDKDKSLTVIQTTSRENIPPLYYDKSYYLVPDLGAEKAYMLLYTALKETDKVAIARSVLRNQSGETLMSIMPRGDVLTAVTLHFEAEINDLPKDFQRPEAESVQLTMAKQLIDAMDRPYDAAAFKDDYQDKVRDLIRAKISNQEVVYPAEEQGPTSNVIDLMDALKKSIEQSKPKPKSATKTKKKTS